MPHNASEESDCEDASGIDASLYEAVLFRLAVLLRYETDNVQIHVNLCNALV